MPVPSRILAAAASSGSKSRALSTASSNIMLQYQSTLPHLPVPPLTSTLSAYLRSLRPLLSSTEYQKSEDKVNRFIASETSKILQQRLEQRAQNTENWLAEWWNDYAYFAYRDSVVVNVSYFYVYKDPVTRGTFTQARRAAEIVEAAWKFRDFVVDGTLEPEKTKTGPLCMNAYQWLFHSCRIPQAGVDTTLSYPAHENEYVVVIRKNQFFRIDMRHLSGRILSADELEV